MAFAAAAIGGGGARTAAADPDRDNLAPPAQVVDGRVPAAAAPDQPNLYVDAGGSAVPFGEIGGYLEVGRRVVSNVWVRGRVARVFDTNESEDEMQSAFTQVGAGLEWRKCTWPGFACGGAGAMVTVGTGETGPTVVPYVDGELGIGQLALRLGLFGQVGGTEGVGTTAAVVFRY